MAPPQRPLLAHVFPEQPGDIALLTTLESIVSDGVKLPNSAEYNADLRRHPLARVQTLLQSRFPKASPSSLDTFVDAVERFNFIQDGGKCTTTGLPEPVLCALVPFANVPINARIPVVMTSEFANSREMGDILDKFGSDFKTIIVGQPGVPLPTLTAWSARARLHVKLVDLKSHIAHRTIAQNPGIGAAEASHDSDRQNILCSRQVILAALRRKKGEVGIKPVAQSNLFAPAIHGIKHVHEERDLPLAIAAMLASTKAPLSILVAPEHHVLGTVSVAMAEYDHTVLLVRSVSSFRVLAALLRFWCP